MFIVTETLSMFGRSLEQRKKEKRRKETIEKEKSMIDNQKFGTAAALQKVGVCRFLRTSNAPKSSSSCSFAFSLTNPGSIACLHVQAQAVTGSAYIPLTGGGAAGQALPSMDMDADFDISKKKKSKKKKT